MKLCALDPRVRVEGKTVLVRIDADVPVVKGRVVEGKNGRLARASVGIEWLRQRGAKIVLLAHRGRPDGKRITALSMAPVARRLEQLLGSPVKLSRDIVGPRVLSHVHALENGDVLLLENVRYLDGETKDDAELARAWASLGDLYVNDAFASSHRSHASVHALARLLPAYAGLELQREVEELSDIVSHPKKPLVVVLGGAKIHTKVGTLEAFLRIGAQVAIGGALAHPFFVAKHLSVGRSLADPADVPIAKRLLRRFAAQILLPEDVATVRVIRRRAPIVVKKPGTLEAEDRIVDLGPSAIRHITEELATAKTIVWNGPLGVCEIPDFAKGTEVVARKIAAMKGRATTVVGGGDTLPIVERLKLGSAFSLLSTGGGAMMSFLAGEPMPGLEAIILEK